MQLHLLRRHIIQRRLRDQPRGKLEAMLPTSGMVSTPPIVRVPSSAKLSRLVHVGRRGLVVVLMIAMWRTSVNFALTTGMVNLHATAPPSPATRLVALEKARKEREKAKVARPNRTGEKPGWRGRLLHWGPLPPLMGFLW